MTEFRGRKIDAVIDVRSRLECLFGKVSGAVNLPLNRLERAMPGLAGIGRQSTLLVYCASGVRSAHAVALLHRMGYAKAIDGGGIATVRRELRQA